MADMMTFPETIEEFMEQYKITDTEQIYTNGTELVPIFRIMQWFDHKPEPHWIPVSEGLPEDWKDVLVWFEYFRYGDYNCMYSTYGIGNYINQYDSWLINHETGWKDLHVFAWMSLPKPPKMETVYYPQISGITPYVIKEGEQE